MEKLVPATAGNDFIYDRFGHLLAETNDSTGAAIREYVWKDDLPVDMVDDTGSSPIVYYIHTDQLGTPQKVTDAKANVVWDGVFDPFGNAVASTGANWGTGLWGGFTWEPQTPATMPLRFPGQYADAETALNQNWHRDYDPTIGRYIESDPIGLAGGVNTYAYVLDMPLHSADNDGTGIVDCVKAIRDLLNSAANLDGRVNDIVNSGNSPDQGHLKALGEARNRVKNDLDRVLKYCGCEIDAAAAVAIATAALDAAAAYLPYAAPAALL